MSLAIACGTPSIRVTTKRSARRHDAIPCSTAVVGTIGHLAFRRHQRVCDVFCAPRDVARLIAGRQASEQTLQLGAASSRSGSTDDDPYFRFLGRLVRGDLGESFFTSEPVNDIVRRDFRSPPRLHWVEQRYGFLSELLPACYGNTSGIPGGSFDYCHRTGFLLDAAVFARRIAAALFYSSGCTWPASHSSHRALYRSSY